MSALRNALNLYDEIYDGDEEEEEEEEYGQDDMGAMNAVDRFDVSLTKGQRGFGDDNQRASDLNHNDERGLKPSTGALNAGQGGGPKKAVQKKLGTSGLSLSVQASNSDPDTSGRSPSSPSSSPKDSVRPTGGGGGGVGVGGDLTSAAGGNVDRDDRRKGINDQFLRELLISSPAGQGAAFEPISPKQAPDTATFTSTPQARSFQEAGARKIGMVSTPLPPSLAPLKTHVASYSSVLKSDHFKSIIYIIPFLTNSEPETLTASLQSVKGDIRELASHNDYYKQLFAASTTMIEYISKSQTSSDIIENINAHNVTIDDNKNLQKLYKQLLVKQQMKEILMDIHALSKDIETIDRMIVSSGDDIVKASELVSACEKRFRAIVGYSDQTEAFGQTANTGTVERRGEGYPVQPKRYQGVAGIQLIRVLDERLREKKRRIISKVSEGIKDILSGERHARDYLGDDCLLDELIQSRKMVLSDWFLNLHTINDELVALKPNKSVVDRLVTLVNCLFILGTEGSVLVELVNGNIEKVSKTLHTKIQQHLGESKPPPFDFIDHIVKLHLIFPFVQDVRIQQLVSIEKIATMINQDVQSDMSSYREIDSLIYARPKLELGWFITTQQNTGVLFNIETLFLPFISFLRGIPVPSIVEVASKKLTKMYAGTSNKINTRLITNYVRSCEMAGNSLVDYRDPVAGKTMKIFNTFEIILDTISRFLEITRIYPIMIINRSVDVSDEISFITHKSLSTVGGGHSAGVGQLDVVDGNEIRYNLRNLDVDESLFQTFLDFCFDKEVDADETKGTGGDETLAKDDSSSEMISGNSNKMLINELMTVSQVERTIHRIHSCDILRKKLNSITSVFNEIVFSIPLDQRKGKTDTPLEVVVLEYIRRGDAALCPYMTRYINKIASLVMTVNDTICYNYFKLLRDIGVAVLAYLDMKATNIVLESLPINASDNTISLCMRLVLVHKTLRELLLEEDVNTLFNQVPRFVNFVFSRFIKSTKRLNKNGAEFLRLNVKEVSRLMARIGCDSEALNELYNVIDSRPLID